MIDDCITAFAIKTVFGLTRNPIDVGTAYSGSIIPFSNRSDYNNLGLPTDLEIHIFPGVSNTYTLSADNFKSAKIQDFTRSWNLKSGKVDKITYDMFADILTSPYVCLWEKDKDHLHYVTVDTSNWEEKKVKEKQQK